MPGQSRPVLAQTPPTTPAPTTPARPEPSSWAKRALSVATVAVGVLGLLACLALAASTPTTTTAGPAPDAATADAWTINPQTLAQWQKRFAGKRSLKVLFIGNSFTSSNSMVAMTRAITGSLPGSRRVEAAEYTRWGQQLSTSWQDPKLRAWVATGGWDVVVLQEYSNLLSLPGQSVATSEATFRAIAQAVRAHGGLALLFMTWGYQRGDVAKVPGDTYESMQARLINAYQQIGQRVGAAVAPVGVTWGLTHAAQAGLPLWHPDRKHPSRLGSYAAACTFAELLGGVDVRQARYGAGVPAEPARLIRARAHTALAGM